MEQSAQATQARISPMQTATLEMLTQRLIHTTGKLPVHPQMYFKPALTALSHAMEDQVLAAQEPTLIIATFQRERFYRQEANRYLRIAEKTDQVYVLAAPETDFANRSGPYETIAFEAADSLSQEWNLVVVGPTIASCLIAQERESHDTLPQHVDAGRRFEGIWTFERSVALAAAELMLDRILVYRPELRDKVAIAKAQFLHPTAATPQTDPSLFAERLVTYLQAGQYKLLKAYRSIAEKERRERLVNLITTAIRQSLNIEAVLQVAVQELGQTLGACRCLIYPCQPSDTQVQLQHEYLGAAIGSVRGQLWPLQGNALFHAVLSEQGPLYMPVTAQEPRIQAGASWLQAWVERYQITGWLLVPILHQGEMVGMVELHQCRSIAHAQNAPGATSPSVRAAPNGAASQRGRISGTENGALAGENPQGLGCSVRTWSAEDIDLVQAIAPQIGIALIQAKAYAHLGDLNRQLEALERTRYNLTAIVGHELRTPLATVKVCLESLASEPDMPLDLRQVMLNTALGDAERLRRLVQDFLTLSQLESGRVKFHPECVSLQECVDLALSSVNHRQAQTTLPQILAELPTELPMLQVDGERLVEVIAQLLENACKFTEPQGKIMIQAQPQAALMEVTIADTGRGIEPDRLEVIFDRFYQEEGALRRTTGGTGLGLAICRQIVTRLGGEIWAESGGRDQGTCFHFTVPLAEVVPVPPPRPSRSVSARRRRSVS